MTDSWVPLAAIGGIVLVATRAYQNAEKGTGIGLGGGGTGFGVNLWQFFFGADPGDDEGQKGGGGADQPQGPSKEPGGSGGTAAEPGDGKKPSNPNEGSGEGQPSSPSNGDGGDKPPSGSGGAGGVGGGSGGGIGGGSGSDPGSGELEEGGSHGQDEGGGNDEGYYEYDPLEGIIIGVDLPPPDISQEISNQIRETVRTLINGWIVDPGASPDGAARLPPQLHEFTGGDILRYWADVALHYHYDLPWGRLDDERDSHKPWIQLWIDILAYASVYLSEEENAPVTMSMSEEENAPVTMSMSGPLKISRRGIGDTGIPIFRSIEINPLTLRPM